MPGHNGGWVCAEVPSTTTRSSIPRVAYTSPQDIRFVLEQKGQAQRELLREQDEDLILSVAKRFAAAEQGNKVKN